MSDYLDFKSISRQITPSMGLEKIESLCDLTPSMLRSIANASSYGVPYTEISGYTGISVQTVSKYVKMVNKYGFKRAFNIICHGLRVNGYISKNASQEA